MASSGFREAHQVFDLKIMVKLRFFLNRKRGVFLPLDQFPHSPASPLRWLKSHDLAGTQCGNKLDDFFVRPHEKTFALTHPEGKAAYHAFDGLTT